MYTFLEEQIKNELQNNLLFKQIFDNFEFPTFNGLENNLHLTYTSNEYTGYYKKDIYFDLVPKKEFINSSGTLKLTFSSSKKQFDINKAMHLLKTNDIHAVSVTFIIRLDYNNWDSVRYNYTLWKEN